MNEHNDDASEHGDGQESEPLQKALFTVIATRQLHYNAQTWQVPMLGLTAQAFLFSIALNASSTRAARLMSAMLALITALASMQLMARHRNGDLHDARWLADAEDAWGLEQVHGPAFKRSRDAHRGGGSLAAVGTSYVWWMIVLGCFGLAGLATIVIELAAPSWLGP